MEILFAICAPTATCAVFICVALNSYYAGIERNQEEMQDAAVKSGHAEYYLDDKNERQWRWK